MLLEKFNRAKQLQDELYSIAFRTKELQAAVEFFNQQPAAELSSMIRLGDLDRYKFTFEISNDYAMKFISMLLQDCNDKAAALVSEFDQL